MIQPQYFLPGKLDGTSPYPRKPELRDKIAVEFFTHAAQGCASEHDHGLIHVCFLSHFLHIYSDKVKLFINGQLQIVNPLVCLRGNKEGSRKLFVDCLDLLRRRQIDFGHDRDCRQVHRNPFEEINELILINWGANEYVSIAHPKLAEDSTYRFISDWALHSASNADSSSNSLRDPHIRFSEV